MGQLTALLRNPLRPFSFLFTSSRKEERLAEYVIREHGLGRSLDEILNDPYVRNRSTPQERARLLDRPDLIHAVGEDTLAAHRQPPAEAT